MDLEKTMKKRFAEDRIKEIDEELKKLILTSENAGQIIELMASKRDYVEELKKLRKD